MADYFTEFSFVIGNVTDEEATWCKQRFSRTGWPGCEWELTKDKTGTELLLYTAGYGDVEQVANFIQRFLRVFRSSSSVAFTFSESCSKPCVGVFGGGAVFVTAETIDHFNTADWVSERIARFSK